MFKKSLLAFLALTLVLVLFIPAALADDTAAQPAEQQTTEPQTTDQQTTEPKGTSEAAERSPIKIKDKSGITDTGLGEKDDVSAMALDSVGPTKYKKSLTYISKYRVYIGYTTYTAPTTGFYTFYSLTNQDTDIEFDYEDDSDPIDYDYRIGAPFSMWVFLEAGESYDIWFYNYGSSSTISYLMTTPLALGSTAYSVSAKGYSTRWMQAFDFVVPEAGDYSLRVTCPSGSKFSLSLWEGTDYIWEEVDPDTGDGYYTFNPIAGSGYITSELYHTFSLEAGTYHLSLLFNNKTSTTAPFTIAMDNDNGIDPAMSEGVVYTPPELEPNDTLTARYFIPAKKGTYKLTCTRSDAKITVISEDDLETDTYLAKNVSPDTIVNLDADTKYYIYYTTNGTEGEIKYSAVYVLSVECSLLGIGAPFSLTVNNRVVTATVANDKASQLVDGVIVSDYATWKTLDSNRDDLPVLNTISLNEGLNRAYIQVTSEDGAHVMEYPVLVYRLSAAADPSIVAFDSEYNEIETGTITNLNVSAVLLGQTSFNPIVVTRNGSYFTWNGSAAFTQTGVYTVNVTDGNGNSADPFTFTIDRTAPLISAKNSSNTVIANNGLSGKPVTVTVSDANMGTKEATRDGLVIDWPADNAFAEHGVYTITSYDAAANKSTFKFTIDTQPPVISAACGATPVVNNGFANGSVIVTVTDPNYKSKYVKKNGVSVSWPSGSKFTYAGKYEVTATDKAGNTAKFTFWIDKTKPSITAKYLNKYTLYDKGYTRYYVIVSVKDTYFDRKEVTLNDAEYTWPADNKFYEEGKYVAKAYDKAGNITSFTFTIDTTLPVITGVTGVAFPIADKACLNTDVTVSVSDLNIPSKSVKRNGDSIKWPTSNTFTSSGSYVVTAKDRAGNTKTFSFIIDKVKPSISVKTVYGSTVYSGRTTKYDVYVKIIDLNPYTKTVTLGGEYIAWPSTNKFTQEGEYKVNAIDKAGNAATEYTFTIYKPARFIVTEKNSGDPVVNNGYANDEEVTISFYEPFYSSKTLTKAGTPEPITWPDDPKEITVSGEGVYTATVKDTYGCTSVFKFTIDRTFPQITVKNSSGTLMSDYFFSNAPSITVKVTDTYYASKTATKDGKKISWPSYDKFTSEGKYVITALDKAGNKSEFNFTIDRSKPVITCKTATNKTVLNNGITNESATIKITDRVGLTTIMLKWGELPEMAVSDTFTLTEHAVYTVTATDALGYKNTFKFTLDTMKPVITATNTFGDIPDLGYSNSDVTITFGEVPAKKSVTKNNVAMTYPSSGKFTAAGVYKVTATDVAGNKQYFTFTIDKTAPVIIAHLLPGNVTDVADDSTVASSVRATLQEINFSSVIVKKDGVTYKKNPLEPGDDASLLWDISGTPNLDLTENGLYEITVTDKAGNTATLTFTIEITA